MASTRRALEPQVKLSPREERVFSELNTRRAVWCNNETLCKAEFGKKPWPLNARQQITGVVNSIQRKLQYHHSNLAIVKRGNGGRAGIEYQLKISKGTLR